MSMLFIFLVSIISIIIVDSLGSILSRKLEFNYIWFSIFSILIFSFTAIYITKLENYLYGLIITGFLGIFDSIIGVIIAKKLKARVNENYNWEVSPKQTISMLFFSVLVGFFTILIAGELKI